MNENIEILRLSQIYEKGINAYKCDTAVIAKAAGKKE